MEDEIVLFLDTNIFLHYQSFDQIAWSKLFGASKVEIIIPPVVVHELNKHKDSHPKPRIRSRASDIIKKLLGLFENSLSEAINSSIIIRLEDREPQIDFSFHQLSKEVNDDELIASILYLKTESPDKKVILVTSDFGLILLGKAKRQGIETYRLSDSYKLLDESDPNEKKISELQAELTKLKHTMPKVSLVFNHGKDHRVFSLTTPQPALTHIEIEKLLAEVKNKYPPIQNTPQETQSQDIQAAIRSLKTMYGVTSDDVDSYNSELLEYYETYIQFLQERENYENFIGRTCELDIWVSNRGTAPAEDMDIYMHFPDGFELFSEKKLPISPRPPKPPSKPRTAMEKMLESSRSLESALMANIRSFDGPEPPSNISSFDIRRTNSYDVHFHVERLKHNIAEATDKIFVNFASYDEAKSFEIDYSILVANLAEPTKGKLYVVIEKS